MPPHSPAPQVNTGVNTGVEEEDDQEEQVPVDPVGKNGSTPPNQHPTCHKMLPYSQKYWREIKFDGLATQYSICYQQNCFFSSYLECIASAVWNGCGLNRPEYLLSFTDVFCSLSRGGVCSTVQGQPSGSSRIVLLFHVRLFFQ